MGSHLPRRANLLVDKANLGRIGSSLVTHLNQPTTVFSFFAEAGPPVTFEKVSVGVFVTVSVNCLAFRVITLFHLAGESLMSLDT